MPFSVYMKEISTEAKKLTIKSKVAVWCAKQNGSGKDKVCSLKTGCSRNGAKKCVMFLT